VDPKPRLGVRHWLTLLVIGTTVPLVVFGAAALYKMTQDARTAQEQGQADTVRALALAVDGEVRAWTAVVTALAESQSLRPARLVEFYEEARLVAAPHDGWVVLTVASGEQLLNTLRPFGAPLAKTSSPETIAAVFRDGKPVISDVIYGTNAQRYLIAVAVPVIRNGKVVHCLTLNFAPKRLSGLLQRQQFSSTWIAALNDRQGRVVARSQHIDARIGKPTVPWLIAAIQAAEHGLATGTLTDGRVGQVAFRRLQEVPWTVTLTIPVAEMPSARPVWGFALLALLLGGVALSLTLVVSRRITIPLGRLAANAEALVRGDAPDLGGSLQIRELQTLQYALFETAAAAQALQVEQKRAVAAEEWAKASAAAAQAAREHAQALQASEERFRALFEGATDAILVTDPAGAGRVLAVNPAACRLFGYTEAEFLGLPMAAILDQQEAQVAPMLQARERNGQTLAEFIYMRKDGTRFSGELTSALIGPPGPQRYAMSIIRNISARKQTEAALYTTLQRFYRVLSNMYAEILLVADDERVEFANQAFCDGFGLTEAPAELVGLTAQAMLEKIKPAYRDPDAAIARIREILDRDQPVKGEEIARRDGRTCLRDFVPLRVEGRSFGRLWQHVDITERQRAEAALQEGQARLETVFAAIPDAVLEYDAGGRPVRANAAALQALGLSSLDFTREQAVTLLRFTHLDGDAVRPEDLPTSRALRGDLVAGELYAVRTADAVEHVISAYAAPIRQGDTVTGVVSLWHDVTDLKRAEEGLRQERATLEQRVAARTAELSRAVEQLSVQAAQLRSLASELTLVEQRERVRLAGVLHDGLQQLLVAAKLRVNLLMRTSDSTVREGCQEVGALLEDAIADARSLTMELSPPILRTGGLLAGLDWLARWSREKHHLTVHVQAPAAALPPVPEDLTVLLFQSVRELLLNTVKYAGVSEASVILASQDGGLTLTVADTGVGFDPTTLRGEGGTTGGFGLAGIRHRLELLGGCMTISSAPGRGTQVTLAVLLRPADLVAAPLALPQPLAASSSGTPPPAGSPRQIRILLVDDHQVVRHALAQLLRAEPDLAVVGEAGTGSAAVALTRQLTPEVVLMDINLPEMDGIQATRLIHAEFPSIRVIGVSMFDSGDQQVAMQAAGAEAYVTKAGAAEALLAAIRGRSGGSGTEQVLTTTP
jgi:PAS domain S-box-containing protein